MTSGSERRKHMRAPFTRPILYRGEGPDLFRGHQARDISAGGIRMNVQNFIPLKSRVTVRLQLTDLGQVFDLEGEVVWIREEAHIEGYQVGISFDGGPSYAKWQVARYVYQNQDEGKGESV